LKEIRFISICLSRNCEHKCSQLALKNFAGTVAGAIPEHAAGKPLEIWFCLRRPAGQDEARVGQKGTLTMYGA
jgi:hypothetical protein